MSALDIYGPQVTLIPKDRAFRIEIDNIYATPSSRKKIKYHQETLILDGQDGPQVGRASQRPDPITIDFDDVLTKTYTFTDPVTQQQVTLSLAGVALAINMDYVARRTYQKSVEDLKRQLADGDITEAEYDTQLAALNVP